MNMLLLELFKRMRPLFLRLIFDNTNDINIYKIVLLISKNKNKIIIDIYK